MSSSLWTLAKDSSWEGGVNSLCLPLCGGRQRNSESLWGAFQGGAGAAGVGAESAFEAGVPEAGKGI